MCPKPGHARLCFQLFMTACVLLVSLNLSAQETPGATSVFKIALVDPGISYEQRIGNTQTVALQGVVRSRISLGYSDAIGTTSDIYFDPALNFQYRYYYNFGRRYAMGKNTLRNSANYLTAQTELQWSKRPLHSSGADEADRRLVHSLGAAWGFQRNYNSHISLDIQLGAEYNYGRTTIYPGGANRHYTWHGRFSETIRIQFGLWIK